MQMLTLKFPSGKSAHVQIPDTLLRKGLARLDNYLIELAQAIQAFENRQGEGIDICLAARGVWHTYTRYTHNHPFNMPPKEDKKNETFRLLEQAVNVLEKRLSEIEVTQPPSKEDIILLKDYIRSVSEHLSLLEILHEPKSSDIVIAEAFKPAVT